MNSQPIEEKHSRYVRAVQSSKRARWDLEDLLRDRSLDRGARFLPDGLSRSHALEFLTPDEQRFVSQIQGRTYSNIFGLVERFINAKVLELSARHYFGDQVALEALVRFSDEELKHQELFRRLELLCDKVMAPGYTFSPDPNGVARVVLGKSTWSVLALTCLIELFTQAHYIESLSTDQNLDPLFRDVFRAHWMEESQHAILDEIEWVSADAKLSDAERSAAVTDLIDLVGAVDGILRGQATADAAYFLERSGRAFGEGERSRIGEAFLNAYRYQYIFSGVERTRFPLILRSLIPSHEFDRVVNALAPLK